MNARLLDTLCDLIRIKSINPAYAGGVPESGVAEYMQRFFVEHEIPVFEQPVFPGRSNLIGALPGRNNDRRVVFEAHMDTAGVEGMTIPPFQPEISGGKIYGRGACDTKGGLAAMMYALASLARERITPPCEIWVVGAVDEEFSFRGALKLCEGLEAAAGVVTEPTSLRLVAATKGCLRFRIVVHGKAAHSSKPELGVNAVSHMIPILVALERDAGSLAADPHPLLGRRTFNIGTIQGGTQVNIVPESCVIEIDRRLLPGEEPGEVFRKYVELVRSIPGVHAEIQPLLEDLPLETPVNSKVVTVASQVLTAIGLNGEPQGVPYGSDASKLSRVGVPSVVIGPGSIDQAHAAVEFVEIAQVEQAFEFFRQFMFSFD